MMMRPTTKAANTATADISDLDQPVRAGRSARVRVGVSGANNEEYTCHFPHCFVFFISYAPALDVRLRRDVDDVRVRGEQRLARPCKRRVASRGPASSGDVATARRSMVRAASSPPRAQTLSLPCVLIFSG